MQPKNKILGLLLFLAMAVININGATLGPPFQPKPPGGCVVTVPGYPAVGPRVPSHERPSVPCVPEPEGAAAVVGFFLAAVVVVTLEKLFGTRGPGGGHPA